MQSTLLNSTLLVRRTMRAWFHPSASILVLLSCIFAATAQAEVRIKDITYVDGQLTHTLTGMGLVAGLNGTGGTTPATREFAANLLIRYGNRIDPLLRQLVRTDTQLRTNSLAVVMVTAKVAEYTTAGAPFDVTVSAFDDATSVQGGVLIMTPLRAIDGHVYATASGSVTTGGFSFTGDAASAQKNHPTTGAIPNGGTLQQAFCEVKPTDLRQFRLSLRNPDLETAGRIVMAINKVLPKCSKVVTPGLVEVRLPASFEISGADFLSQVQQLRITPDSEARVVINERTGTVVFGENVKISQVAITHANLTILTTETPQVSQPNPLANGETVVVPRSTVDIVEEDSAIQLVPETTSVSDLVEALNALGVTPRDLSSIFQQLKAANALHAHLEFR